MLCIILLSRVYFERARSMVPVTNNLEYKENSAAKILLQGGKMNLNRATYQELQALPAIGPKRAKSIVALRTQLQKIETLDQLLVISGISKGVLDQIRPYVVLED